MVGWYFADESRKLRYGDNRLITIGRTHRVKGDVLAGYHGLHASERAIDALISTPRTGKIVYRVKLHGKLSHGFNTSCASCRTYLSGNVDASETLEEFARWCALQVVRLWDCPDVIKKYLETGDEEIRSKAKRLTYWMRERSASGYAEQSAYSVVRDEHFSQIVKFTNSALILGKGLDYEEDYDETLNVLNIELERRLYDLIG